ncbi:MAG: UvrD-helicase domain-containing protein [Lachnospiraceae bacterium]|nr:UvrD-helicase domain-containing protein [Lachnospiraceae bacterium]
MAVQWTREQQLVIDTRGKDILVSAAAGSGKTAVLVERILKMITDETKPVDIDRLLVVTFTNAAAAEMRGRIRDALEARAEKDPDNAHLQRQLVLVHNAKITTIHSFCLHVLRNHFQTIGIDPAFRIADEGEVMLLEQDAVKEIVDEAYEEIGQTRREPDGSRMAAGKASGSSDATEPENEFETFLEQFATGKGDAEVEEMILQIYHFALGQPFPREWLRECRAAYEEASAEEEWHPSWLEFVEADTAMRLSDIRKQVLLALTIAREPDGPYPYEKALISDLDLVDALIGRGGTACRIPDEIDASHPQRDGCQETRGAGRFSGCQETRSAGRFSEYLEAFRSMGTFARLGTKKDERISEEKKQRVMAIRSGYKDQITSLRDQYYYDDLKSLREVYQKSGLSVRVLTKLTEAFMERLSEKKSEKNVLDFGDMEHLALNALVKRNEDGSLASTAVAMEYAENFEEVMTDEYQDSNLVQELILRSVSGKGRGLRLLSDASAASGSSDSGQEPEVHNRFMVGDVKQSIYRFRLARPELFMEKYHSYPALHGTDWEASHSTNVEPLHGTNGEASHDTNEEPLHGAGGEFTENSCRIDLHRNFRSRPQVLDAVNDIFRKIMTESLGGVEYDADAALYPGAAFPDGAASYQAELLLLDGSAAGDACSWPTDEELPASNGISLQHSVENGGAHSSNEPGSQRTAGDAVSSADLRAEEAKMVGRRIRELVGTMPVLDKETGGFRPARYGDIVILLRTVSGWAEVWGETLGEMGIPCFTGSQKGYFSTAEIRVVLSYLQILDNPMQDIPFAAVLRSAIGRFGDEELAQIRLAAGGNTRLSFYDCCLRYRNKPSDVKTAQKLNAFFETFEMLRGKSSHTPVHQLLWEILDATGYGEYAAALPAGRQRKANLDMLVEKAIAYEATSYRGLYHFMRYIENLQKYEVDYGEANIASEADDTVRIMSIHKSKGLEFPIVFVSGLGKAFNEMDARGQVVMHSEWGIACDYVWNADGSVRIETGHGSVKTETEDGFVKTETEDGSGGETSSALPRMRQSTLLKKAIGQRISSEALGEELRVLYVAMTRAKEKLILTGSVKNLEKKLTEWEMDASAADETLSYSCLSGASTYLDWVVPALLGQPEAGDGLLFGEEWVQNSLFDIHVTGPAQNELADSIGHTNALLTLDELLHLDTEVCQDQEAGSYLETVFAAEGSHEMGQAIPGKVTVSELKKLSQKPEEPDAYEMYSAEEEIVPLIPRFLEKAPETLSGADRGTIYHTFMENLDFSKKDDLQMQLEDLVKCGKMTAEEASVIHLKDILAFVQSRIGTRMARAASERCLFREQPFVLGVPAKEVMKNGTSDETILVQGIIDAYLIEDGQITIVDYKTDRVSDGSVLVNRYRIQMDYYAKALERLTGRKIRDRIIYSFCLRKEIKL